MEHNNPFGSYEPQQPLTPQTPDNSPAPPAPPTPDLPPAPAAQNPMGSPVPTAPPQPQPMYQQPVAASADGGMQQNQHGDNSAGVIILQWLTYAFWGWTVLSLSALTGAVLANMIADSDTGAFTPYAIAAILVLLPIALVCDHLYAKREPEKKVGGAMIVMVIHAVIFGLLGVGSLIWTAFSIVTLITSSTDHPTLQVSLYTTTIVTIYYAATFVRTLSPVRFKWIRRAFQIFMLASISIIVILGFVGPVAKSNKTKDDKLIQNNLYSVTTSINSYSRTNKKLPESLKDLSLSGDTKKLVEKDLLRYTPNTKQTLTPSTSKTSTSTSRTSTTYSPIATYTTYYYTICATYKEKSSYYKEDNQNYYGADDYTTSPSTYSHPAGEVCYKIKTSNYSYDY